MILREENVIHLRATGPVYLHGSADSESIRQSMLAIANFNLIMICQNGSFQDLGMFLQRKE